MITSKEELLRAAKSELYKPEILEKVHKLLDVLVQISEVPYFKDRLVLKGGTALNLFCFERIPRLSVDIDLNYIGSLDRAFMLEERPLINNAIEEILRKNKFENYRSPGGHAGGKLVWRYASLMGQKGNLEIDLNYMYRQPLLKPMLMTPVLPGFSELKFPVLDIHELAAGKFSALFSRTASRDLFDAHHLLTQAKLDQKTFRLAFCVYIAMTGLPVSALSIEAIQPDLNEFHDRLLPVLRQSDLIKDRRKLLSWIETMLEELKTALTILLPLSENERKFIEQVSPEAEICPELITDDEDQQAIIRQHPALLWATQRGKK